MWWTKRFTAWRLITPGNIKSEFYGMRYNSVETHLSINYTFTGFAGDKPIDLAKNKPAYQLADFKNEGADGPADDQEEL